MAERVGRTIGEMGMGATSTSRPNPSRRFRARRARAGRTLYEGFGRDEHEPAEPPRGWPRARRAGRAIGEMGTGATSMSRPRHREGGHGRDAPEPAESTTQNRMDWRGQHRTSQPSHRRDGHGRDEHEPAESRRWWARARRAAASRGAAAGRAASAKRGASASRTLLWPRCRRADPRSAPASGAERSAGEAGLAAAALLATAAGGLPPCLIGIAVDHPGSNIRSPSCPPRRG